MSVNVHEVLTDEEIEDCHKAFMHFDADHSGTIESWELKGILEALGQKPTDQEILHMISEVDDNDSNSIEFSEFLQVMARQKLESNDSSKDRDIFDAWVAVGGGADGSGFVDAELLIKIIKHDFCLNIDIEKMIKEMDTSGDGEIDFEEFQQLVSDALHKHRAPHSRESVEFARWRMPTKKFVPLTRFIIMKMTRVLIVSLYDSERRGSDPEQNAERYRNEQSYCVSR
mmetsp:Transcript_20738/g.66163  ORF Transcript_20738/g.66163 Transcript_20738/m.66163 type:complete len:228 (+) Transcript_20738:197-880(+)